MTTHDERPDEGNDQLFEYPIRLTFKLREGDPSSEVYLVDLDGHRIFDTTFLPASVKSVASRIVALIQVFLDISPEPGAVDTSALPRWDILRHVKSVKDLSKALGNLSDLPVSEANPVA